MSRMRALLLWFAQDDEHKALRLWLLALLVLGSGLGLRDPWPPAEPALALMMRQMADSGEWLIPYLAGEPFSDHPPLVIWLGAALYSVTGSLRLGFLLPSLLAALGTLWLVFDLGRRLWGERAGRLAAIALLCAFQFSLQAHRGQVDATFTFFTTLALYGLLRYLLLEASPRWLVAAGAAIGFAMLTKGAGYIALLVLLPWLWMRAQHWDELPERPGLRALWPLVATAFGVVLSWALPALAFVSGADDFALDQFRRELLWNLLGGADLLLGGPEQPPWYLTLQAVALWLPLTLLLPWLLPIWRQRLRDRDPRTGLLLGFVLAVIALFSMLPGRHGVQILPALPAFALLVGVNIGGTWWRPGVQWLSRGTLLAIGAGLLTLSELALREPLEFGLRLPPDTPWGLLVFMGGLGALALVLSIALSLRSRHQALALPVFIGVAWVLIGWAIYPWLNTVRTPERLLAKVEAELPAQGEVTLAMLDWRPQFSLATRRPLRPLYGEDPGAAIEAFCGDGAEYRGVIAPQRVYEDMPLPALGLGPAITLGVRHRSLWLYAPCVRDEG